MDNVPRAQARPQLRHEARMTGSAAVDLALHAGMQAQLGVWRRTVLAQGNRLGWKIGFGERAAQERVGIATPVIGFLRRDRLLQAGGRFLMPANATIKAEVEVAIRVGRDVDAADNLVQAEAAIVAMAPAVEVVDVTQPLTGIEALLAGNLYHAAVLIGPELSAIPSAPRHDIQARLHVNGSPGRASEAQRLPANFGEVVQVTAQTLSAYGERLVAGDWIICGAIIEPLVVKAGDEIEVDMPRFERIALGFSAR